MVEVLQAVHLLLALDLFVVVVGVDARWLLRSVESQYEKLLSQSGESRTDDLRASPQDYLEKIFNIPFALPRMSAQSFNNLIISLANDGTVAEDVELPNREHRSPAVR